MAFFDLESRLRLALWPRRRLAHDSGLPASAPAPTSFCLTHNVMSRGEVDEVLARAAGAGATIAQPAAHTFYGGYAAYSQDPDAHLWEVACNPQLLPPA